MLQILPSHVSDHSCRNRVEDPPDRYRVRLAPGRDLGGCTRDRDGAHRAAWNLARSRSPGHSGRAGAGRRADHPRGAGSRRRGWGATSAILTHNGAVTAGALVVCLTNGEGAVSGVAAAAGRDLTEAGQGAARLILSGWPFRMRYPRGLGLAFVKPGFGAPAEVVPAALASPDGPQDANSLQRPLVAGRVRRLGQRAARQRRLSRGRLLDRTWLCRGIRGARRRRTPKPSSRGPSRRRASALKRLEGRRCKAGSRRWSRARATRRSAAPPPTNGPRSRARWTPGHPASAGSATMSRAYGRGVRPVDCYGSLVVVALGDAPRR